MEEFDVYDFDKTLYKKDSTIEFYRFCLKEKKSIVIYLPIQIVYLVLFMFTKKDKYKEKFFVFLRSVNNVNNVVERFWIKNKKLIRNNMISSEKRKIVISASPEFLIKKICNEIGIDIVIATKVNYITGKFESKNCHDSEKLKRLKLELPRCKINNFYSDSYSDKFLAREAKNAYLVGKNGEIEEWFCK